MMQHDEILKRAAILTRLWSAYPSAGRATPTMLVEYVNATRGLTLDSLERCVDHAIARGGEFIPSAGDVVKRAAEYVTGGPPSGEDKDAWFHFRNKVNALMATVQKQNAQVEPLRQIVGQVERKALIGLADGLKALPEGE